jgi:flagellar hook-associated protein 2
MAITAAGVGSGLDINGIVTQLMQLERQPVYKLEATNREYDAQLSAYGKISSAVSSFETAMENLGSIDKFKTFSADSSDEDVLTASADSGAAAGIYSLAVSRLAQNHKLGSAEIDKTNLFTGNLDITVDGSTVTIDTTGLTLSGIRDAINSDADNPGVTASILNIGNGNQRLILTSEESGSAKSITVDETGVGNDDVGPANSALGLSIANRDKDGLLLGSTAELDSAYTVDGYSLTASSNSVSDVIDGITLNFSDIGSATLTLNRDTEKIIENVEEFVSAFNDVQKTLNGYAKGELAGDSTLRSIQAQFRSVLNTAPSGLSGPYNFLSQVGILSDARTGELELDSDTLTKAMDADFQSVADLFANDDQGYAFRFAQLADDLQDNDRAIELRKKTLNNRIDDNEDRILDLDYRLEMKEKALRAKFASLDSLIASMQSSSSFLSQIASF